MIGVVLLLAAATLHASPPSKKPDYARLIGGNDVMAFDNREAARMRLTRFSDETYEWYRRKYLVPLPRTPGICVNEEQVPKRFRYVRPHTRRFLIALGKDYVVQFPGTCIWVNSAARTMEYQRWLRGPGKNANAINSSGPQGSSHLYGSTVDLRRLMMGIAQLYWLEARLIQVEKDGCINATKETGRHTMLHVMVFDRCGIKVPVAAYKKAVKSPKKKAAAKKPLKKKKKLLKGA